MRSNASTYQLLSLIIATQEIENTWMLVAFTTVITSRRRGLLPSTQSRKSGRRGDDRKGSNEEGNLDFHCQWL